MGLERLSEPSVDRAVQGEHHDSAGLPVQPVVERRVRGGPRLFQVAKDGRVEVVVGIGRGLLAGYARFLVVGQKIRVPKEDARRIDLVGTPRPAPRLPNANLFPALEPSCRIALRAPVHLHGTEIDEIVGILFGHEEFRGDMGPKGCAGGFGARTPAKEGWTRPGQGSPGRPPLIRHRESPRRGPRRRRRSPLPWPHPPSRPRPRPCHRPFRARSFSSTWPWTWDRFHRALP